MRKDTQVTQQRVDELNQVVDWIQPVFTRTDPHTGEQHRLITANDAAKISAGYACGECGAVYRIVMPQCAVCREPIGLQLEPMRPEWPAHLADREQVVGGSPVGFDEFMAEVLADPEIEQR